VAKGCEQVQRCAPGNSEKRRTASEQRLFSQSKFGYKNFIPMFKAEHFDACA
jgi:hypothetical protein